jgi:ubiquinone/menaquinone biosynthesis C-methylase UbiE
LLPSVLTGAAMATQNVLLPLGAACLILGVGSQAQDHKPPAAGDPPGRHMEHRFDDAERYAKSFDDPARDEWQMPARVIDALAIRPGQSIADIGAGTGYFSVRLAKTAASATIYAVDVERSMIDFVRQRAAKEGLKNVVPVLATAGNANLPASIDIALVVDTYHHIPNRAAYFRELRKSMKRDARLAIIDFRRDSPEGPPVEFRFTPEQVETELAPSGFRVVARHDFLPRQYFLVFQAGER